MRSVYYPICTRRRQRNGPYHTHKSRWNGRHHQQTSGTPLVPSATSSEGQATTAKGLSRMRRNPHVRFLGGWRVATPSGYPVGVRFPWTTLRLSSKEGATRCGISSRPASPVTPRKAYGHRSVRCNPSCYCDPIYTILLSPGTAVSQTMSAPSSPSQATPFDLSSVNAKALYPWLLHVRPCSSDYLFIPV